MVAGDTRSVKPNIPCLNKLHCHDYGHSKINTFSLSQTATIMASSTSAFTTNILCLNELHCHSQPRFLPKASLNTNNSHQHHSFNRRQFLTSQTILETKDGGSTWVSRFIPSAEDEDFNYRFNSISFKGKKGWIVGKPAILLYTSDTGDTWQRIPLSAQLPGDILIAYPFIDL